MPHQPYSCPDLTAETVGCGAPLRSFNGCPVGRRAFIVSLACMKNHNLVLLDTAGRWELGPNVERIDCSASDFGLLAFKVRAVKGCNTAGLAVCGTV